MWDFSIVFLWLGISAILLGITNYYVKNETGLLQGIFKYFGGVLSLFFLILGLASGMQIIDFQTGSGTAQLTNIYTYLYAGLTSMTSFTILIFGIMILVLTIKAVVSIADKKDQKEMGREIL